ETLFQRLTKSIFSAQVGLSVAVTLLTVFGAKAIEAIWKAIKGTQDLTAVQERYNASVNASIKTQQAYKSVWESHYSQILRKRQAELKELEDIGAAEDDLLKKRIDVARERALAAQENLRDYKSLGEAYTKAASAVEMFLELQNSPFTGEFLKKGT